MFKKETENTKETGKMSMQSPWICFVNAVTQLFQPDPEVEVKWDEAKKELLLVVSDSVKAEAISSIIPCRKDCGGVVVLVNVKVEPKHGDSFYVNAVEAAFKGNPLFEGLYQFQPEGGLTLCNYAVFKKKVIQYFNDNIADLNGNRSTLAEDLAREVLITQGVFYCTSDED
jgi:hypothetical protein